jgi:pyruvate decarboxylase
LVRKWTQLLDVLAPEDLSPKPRSYTVRTKRELDALLEDASFASADGIQLVEVMMDKFDAPMPLLRQAELSGKTNHYVAEML